MGGAGWDPVSFLTGGQWQVATHHHGKILLGHIKVIKVPQEVADKIIPLSGRQAVYAAVIDKAEARKTVTWLPKARQSTEGYFRQSLAQAQKHKVLWVMRQGGASNLGLPGVAQAPVLSNQVRSWQLWGGTKTLDSKRSSRICPG